MGQPVKGVTGRRRYAGDGGERERTVERVGAGERWRRKGKDGGKTKC
jgi:hypothetical protein